MTLETPRHALSGGDAGAPLRGGGAPVGPTLPGPHADQVGPVGLEPTTRGLKDGPEACGTVSSDAAQSAEQG